MDINMKSFFKVTFIYVLVLSTVCSMILPMYASEKPTADDPDTIEHTLTIATYNIKDGRHKIDDKADRRTIMQNLENIAKEIIKYSPDIVGFQEVDKNTQRTDRQDQIKLLAEMTGYPYYKFTKAIDYQGGGYGHAILSRYPIVSYDATAIPAFKSGQEKRALAHAVIDVDGTHVNFFNTHINSGSDGTSQHAFDNIANVITKFDNAIQVGDFNARYSTGYYSTFKGFKCVNVGNHVTTADNGNSIDNICYTNEFKVLCSSVAPEENSDHFLVYAVFSFKRNK